MIELYNGDCRAFLSNYNGERFDAVITDPPYASGGATLSERSASTSQKYTATKKACPFPDFMGDQMDSRSWLHMMADVLALARVQCHDGAVLVVFCDWRQIPLLTDAVQWGGLAMARNAGLGQTDQPPGRKDDSASRRSSSSGRATASCRLTVLYRHCRAYSERQMCRACSASIRRRSQRKSCGRYAKSVCRADESSTHLREAVRRWRRRSWKGTIRSAWSCPKKLQRARRKD